MSSYRIRTVSQLSGVSTATLRAWERRYGVPSPARTASAYRLYSDADVALIKRMNALVKQGIAASEAARTVLVAREQAPPAAADELDPFAAASERLVDATLRFDPDGLELEVNRALALGPALTLYERTLAPALRRIGELWHLGTVTVAQEHLASQIMLGALIDLVRLSQPVDASRRVALACFADEDHTLGMYGAALRFASWGFQSLILGPRTPPAAIARVVEALTPDAVALSSTIAPEGARARELCDAYADACRGTLWVVGGGGAEAMRPWVEARGGICAGRDAAELRRAIDRGLFERRQSGAEKLG